MAATHASNKKEKISSTRCPVNPASKAKKTPKNQNNPPPPKKRDRGTDTSILFDLTKYKSSKI